MIHKLKIEPCYFTLVEKGLKNYEIRLNDRNFQEGDVLLLEEFYNGSYTGRTLRRVVNNIFYDSSNRFLLHGYVILNFALVLEACI